jgi:hypothetical protein
MTSRVLARFDVPDTDRSAIRTPMASLHEVAA